MDDQVAQGAADLSTQVQVLTQENADLHQQVADLQGKLAAMVKAEDDRKAKAKQHGWKKLANSEDELGYVQVMKLYDRLSDRQKGCMIRQVVTNGKASAVSYVHREPNMIMTVLDDGLCVVE